MWKNCNVLLALALLAGPPAASAAPRIENFDRDTWAAWQKNLPRPAAVVFSTTDCSHCPTTIAALAAQLKRQHRHATLVAVVMDGADAPDLLHDPHYAAVDRLFVFDGQQAALQYAIDPSWRGITPYVALFGRNGAARMTLGTPSPEQLTQWLAGPARTIASNHPRFLSWAGSSVQFSGFLARRDDDATSMLLGGGCFTETPKQPGSRKSVQSSL